MGWFKRKAEEEKPDRVLAEMTFRDQLTGELIFASCIDGKGWRARLPWGQQGGISWENLNRRFVPLVALQHKVFCPNCAFRQLVPRSVDGRTTPRCTAKVEPERDFVTGELKPGRTPGCRSVNPDGNCPYFKAKRSHRATRRTPKRKD